MNGLCHCSELCLRCSELIIMDGSGRGEVCSACWESFLLAHSPSWSTSKRRSSRHFLAFRVATPGAENGLHFNTVWLPDRAKLLSACSYSLAGNLPPAVLSLPLCASPLMLVVTAFFQLYFHLSSFFSPLSISLSSLIVHSCLLLSPPFSPLHLLPSLF